MKKDPTYRKALSHAWRVVRYHPALWIFGLFSLFLGQMGLLDFLSSISVADDRLVFYSVVGDASSWWHAIVQLFTSLNIGADGWIWVVWLILFFISAGLGLLFVSVSSQGALIDGIIQSLKLGKFHHVKVDKAWYKGVSHFWRLLALNVSKKVVTVLLSVLLAAFAYMLAVTNNVFAGVGLGALFIVSVALGLLVSVLLVYAAGYVVVEEYSYIKSIKSAWKLLKDHWVVSLEVGLIVVLLNLGILAAALVLVGLFVVEMSFIWAISFMLGSAVFWEVGLFLSTMILMILFAAIGSLFSVYSTAIWTYLFLVMHKKGLKSRLLGLFKKG
ncbi:hypothetical protein KKG22_03565 [Patescibacteria group bacterium]|nr:hypothetical protein [Patescibacteria group bacterium]MBU1721228.1 hypothetical protein [Patescibacteria group bacterium]MBU1901064.1 hypothetical protein [Patescibacteria group bacterium]